VAAVRGCVVGLPVPGGGRPSAVFDTVAVAVARSLPESRRARPRLGSGIPDAADVHRRERDRRPPSACPGCGGPPQVAGSLQWPLTPPGPTTRTKGALLHVKVRWVAAPSARSRAGPGAAATPHTRRSCCRCLFGTSTVERSRSKIAIPLIGLLVLGTLLTVLRLRQPGTPRPGALYEDTVGAVTFDLRADAALLAIASSWRRPSPWMTVGGRLVVETHSIQFAPSKISGGPKAQVMRLDRPLIRHQVLHKMPGRIDDSAILKLELSSGSVVSFELRGYRRLRDALSK